MVRARVAVVKAKAVTAVATRAKVARMAVVVVLVASRRVWRAELGVAAATGKEAEKEKEKMAKVVVAVTWVAWMGEATTEAYSGGAAMAQAVAAGEVVAEEEAEDAVDDY